MQRQGEIDRGRRFADAALAAGHRDDVSDAGQAKLAAARLGVPVGVTGAVLVAGAGRALGRWLRGRTMGGQHGADAEDARHLQDRLLGRLAQGLQFRAFLGVDLDGEGDVAVAQRQAVHHAGANDVAAPVAAVRGQGDLAQHVQHLGFGYGLGRTGHA